jgi:hypothetical protein
MPICCDLLQQMKRLTRSKLIQVKESLLDVVLVVAQDKCPDKLYNEAVARAAGHTDFYFENKKWSPYARSY